jgi:hypothetical protein
MLTYVEVNHAALLADITVDSHARAEYNMYSAFCAGGSIRVLIFISNILIEATYPQLLALCHHFLVIFTGDR